MTGRGLFRIIPAVTAICLTTAEVPPEKKPEQTDNSPAQAADQEGEIPVHPEIETEGYESQIATSEILQGEWVAWNASTSDEEPQVCHLNFYRDAEGNDRVEYFYGLPTGEVYAWHDGKFEASVTPAGWITEEMSAFYMDLIGGAAMETGLKTEYDDPYSFMGIYEIRYYPELDVIEVIHQFNRPLLEGGIGDSIVFERGSDSGF